MINSFSRETLNQEIAFQMHLIFDFFFFFYRRQIYFLTLYLDLEVKLNCKVNPAHVKHFQFPVALIWQGYTMFCLFTGLKLWLLVLSDKNEIMNLLYRH